MHLKLLGKQEQVKPKKQQMEKNNKEQSRN
jgi:hypothetical protein